jgi:hypothetical protein
MRITRLGERPCHLGRCSEASARVQRERRPADDDALTDEQALEACRREQERRPVDLIGALLSG